MTINAMGAPPEAINTAAWTRGARRTKAVTTLSSATASAPSVVQSDRSPMTMADGDLLFLSRGYLGANVRRRA